MLDDQPERREGLDRRAHSIVGVSLDGFTNGANKNVQTVIALLKFAAGALGFVLSATVAVAIWTFTVAATNDRQDINIAITAEAVQELNDTMREVVTEQKAMRRDVEHLRSGEE